eukprot:scaffold276652_cov36-Tisochrysis_lutea.AAC.3
MAPERHSRNCILGTALTICDPPLAPHARSSCGCVASEWQALLHGMPVFHCLEPWVRLWGCMWLWYAGGSMRSTTTHGWSCATGT